MDVLSIIIPVYNEPELPALLKKITAVSFECEWEIIIVDDGSTDGTREWLLRNQEAYDYQLILLQKNTGKGAAVKQGLLNARGTIVIIQDGDLEYEPRDIPEVVAPILQGKTQVCYGSRYLNPATQRSIISWIKAFGVKSYMTYLGGRIINKMFNFFCRSRLTDVSTCYKAFKTRFLRTIHIHGNGFELEHELTMKVMKQTKIFEVPIHYYPRSYHEGKKIGLFDGLKIAKTILFYGLLSFFPVAW